MERESGSDRLGLMAGSMRYTPVPKTLPLDTDRKRSISGSEGKLLKFK